MRPLVLCVFVLSMFAPQLAAAETLVADKVYEGPVTLEVASQNMRVKMPKGWRGMIPGGGDAFIMERSDGSDGKLFVSIEDGTPQEISTLMSQPLPLDASIVLQPTGELSKKGDTFTRDYTIPGMEQMRGYARARHIDGKAVAAIAVGPAESMAMFKKAANFMVKSAKKFTPKKAKASKPSGKWAGQLADRNLYHFYTVSGHSEKTTLTLCGDGRFSRNFDLSNSTAIGSAAAASNRSGTWSVKGNTLTLRYGNGSVSTKKLEFRDGLLYMDGDKWLREGTRCN